MMDPIPTTIAICGGGACGLSVLLCILRESKKGLCVSSIRIFEKRPQVGPGLAYSEYCGNSIMNMDANTMGLDALDPMHFSRWVALNNPQFEGVRYPPRSLYREYLTFLFNYAVQEASSQKISLEVVPHELVDVSAGDEGFKLVDDGGHILTVDRLVLSLGNFTSRTQPELIGKPGYFDSPWPLRRLHHIPSSSSVTIIGSRLSAIDAAFHLVENGHEGPIYLTSRGGRVPRVQGPSSPYPHSYALHVLARDLENSDSLSNPLRTLTETFKSLAEEQGIHNWEEFLCKNNPLQQLSLDIVDARNGSAHWRSLIDAASPLLERYWNSLPSYDQTSFINRWASMWNTYVHAMPYDNACRLQELLIQGRVMVIDFDEIRLSEGGFTILNDGQRIESEFAIEATGLELDVCRIQSPLVKSLLSSRMLEAHRSGGFAVSQYTMESTNTKGLYVIGSLTTGVHFYTNGIDRNVAHASRIARHLAGKLSYPPAHVALILRWDSIFWKKFLLHTLPAMLKRPMVPFLYLAENLLSSHEHHLDTSQHSGKFSGSHSSNDIDSSVDTENTNELLSEFCRRHVLAVQSVAWRDLSFVSLVTDHYIDTGLLLLDEDEFDLSFERSFVLLKSSTTPPFYVLKGGQNKEGPADTKMYADHSWKEHVTDIEQSITDMVLNYLEAIK